MDTSNLNPYEILNLPGNAAKIDIKRAYRLMAKKFHPDHNDGNPDAEEKFKKIQWAYEELTNEKKKKRHLKPVRTRPYPPAFFKNEDPFMNFLFTIREQQRFKKYYIPGQTAFAGCPAHSYISTPYYIL